MKSEAMKKATGILIIGLLVCSLFSSAVSGEIAVTNVTTDKEINDSHQNTLLNQQTSSKNSIDSMIDSALESNKSAFLFFYADWCGFSKDQKPVIEDLERTYSDAVDVIWLNVEEYGKEAQEFGVRGYPSMLLINDKDDDGYLYSSLGGYTERDELIEKFEKLFGSRNLDSKDSVIAAYESSLRSEIDDALEDDKPVFLLFYGEGCHLCLEQQPIIDALEIEYADQIAFIRVNAEENPQAMNDFGVTWFPAMVLIVDKNKEGYIYQGFTDKETLKHIVPKKQGNACERKWLAGEPLGQGHIFCTQRQVKGVSKTGPITYPENDREVLLESGMRENLKSGSVRGLIAAYGRRWL